jgi:Flp pilus assembly pilin Flp
MLLRNLLREENGAVMVEVAILLTIILVLILGSIDFLLLFYQWNAAAKAVQIGARIAAVSDSVAAGLRGLSKSVVSASVIPGSAMPKFTIKCDGQTATCICNSRACRGLSGFDRKAMNTIVFGRGSSSCSDAKSSYEAGMCDVFPRITPANVVIVYEQTGLGYADRPGGPMPTITISLQNLPFHFFFLGNLLGFRSPQIPASTVSVTAGDLSSAAPSF